MNSNFNLTNLLKLNENSKLQIPSWIKVLQSKVLDLDFYELVKNISESKSREEETRIVQNEIMKLKKAFSQHDQSKEKKRECLIRMIYCHMLGFNVEFGHVNALNMTQDSEIWNKRTGYLALSLCLPDRHELLIMVVNSIQKGLGYDKSNYLEVSSALTALCKLIDKETIPAFLQKVLTLVQHPIPLVRKKAVTALHRFYQLQGYDDIIDSQTEDKLRIALCDKDPSVMAASVSVFLDISKTHSHTLKDLVPSFVGILKQVSEGRLPVVYVYHHIHHPWLQINLLKLLSNLGAQDQKSSEHMYQVVLLTMQQGIKVKNNVSFAILYEAIKCLTSIHPNIPLIETAAKYIHVLLPKLHNNLRYFGIKALTSIVKVSPKSVAQFQMEVIECLESSDDTLKRKSLDLLYRMTNQNNIIPICAKLIDHIRQTKDKSLRMELVSREMELMEKYSPSDYWYIDTMVTLLSIPATHMNQQSAFNLIRLLAEGNQDETEDTKIKLHAVDNFMEKIPQLQQSSNNPLYLLPDLFIKIMTWVLSEYSYLLPSQVPDQGGLSTHEYIINYFCDLLEKEHYNSDTKSWILIAITKLTSHLGKYLPQVSIITNKYTQSRSVQCQQRALELQEISRIPSLMTEIFPQDSYCEDLDLDSVFKKLDQFTSTAISNGAKEYIPIHKRKSTPLIDLQSIQQLTIQPKELNFEYPPPPSIFQQQSYQSTPTTSLPLVPISTTTTTGNPQDDNNRQMVSIDQNTQAMVVSPKVESIIPKSTKIAWTKKGFVGDKPNTVTQTPVIPNNNSNISEQQPQSSSTTQQPTTQQTTTQQPQKKIVDPEKEKLAKQLFSGLGGESVETTNSSETVPKKIKKHQTGVTTQPKVNTNETPLNNQFKDPLIDLSPPLTSTTTTTPTSNSSQLLVEIENTPTKTAITSPTTKSNNSILDDIDNNEILSLSFNTNITSSNINKNILDSDINTVTSPIISSPIRTAISTSTSTLSSQIEPGQDFSIENLNISPVVSKYMSKDDDEVEYQQVFKDKSIVVGIAKIISYLEPQNTKCKTTILLISNLQSTSIGNLKITIPTNNDNLVINITDIDSILSLDDNGTNLSLQSELPAKLTISVILSVKLKKIGFNMSIPITLSNVTNALSIPYEVSDFHWDQDDEANDLDSFNSISSQYQFERSIDIQSFHTVDSRNQLLFNRFIKGLHLKIIHSNEQEYYLVHTLSTSTNHYQCLYKFTHNNQDNTTTFLIKSNDKNLSDVLYRYAFKLYNLEQLKNK
ncbi:adaptin N-terminal domain-containing protein [Tieghemostelium lacteum]|uniref:Adaptin N-terminal domain-containing protein n=1 Tax=Tieghemostelium lacteum TaxID=361077 RepID=A0A151Z2U6_TIELA|nr:adaptin N-terminal domain-containing protein [Tieghemostelium lacteum]|eukprot:KYQ88283.1 adaptin N-terminal domain-containing protein [Tieghemostelium lacteum]